IGECYRSRGITIVNLVGGGGADGQGADRNVSRSSGRGRSQRVVAGIRAADRDAADGDGLGSAHILVVEVGASIAVGEDIATDAVVAQGHRSAGIAIVDLVRRRSADGQGPHSDVGSSGGGGRG